MALKLPPFKLDAASVRSAGGAALEVWARYKLLFLGILGWAIIAAKYPIGWELPAYAGF